MFYLRNGKDTMRWQGLRNALPKSSINEHTTVEANSTLPAAHLLSNAPIDTVTLELLAQWRREDATEDPEKIREAEQELAEFKLTMNENRALSGELPLFP